jgi:Glyoxalase-like domain
MVPPRWPDPAYPKQLHLDIRVSDADQAEQELLLLGAARVPGERETGFRVFADPVGHPFCIVSAATAQADPAPAQATDRANRSGAATRPAVVRFSRLFACGRPQLAKILIPAKNHPERRRAPHTPRATAARLVAHAAMA